MPTYNMLLPLNLIYIKSIQWLKFVQLNNKNGVDYLFLCKYFMIRENGHLDGMVSSSRKNIAAIHNYLFHHNLSERDE